MMESTVAC